MSIFIIKKSASFCQLLLFQLSALEIEKKSFFYANLFGVLCLSSLMKIIKCTLRLVPGKVLHGIPVFVEKTSLDFVLNTI
jgi:hypothetical protein